MCTANRVYRQKHVDINIQLRGIIMVQWTVIQYFSGLLTLGQFEKVHVLVRNWTRLQRAQPHPAPLGWIRVLTSLMLLLLNGASCGNLSPQERRLLKLWYWYGCNIQVFKYWFVQLRLKSDMSAKCWPVKKHTVQNSCLTVCLFVCRFYSFSLPSCSFISFSLSLTPLLCCDPAVHPIHHPATLSTQNYYFFDVLPVENKSIFLAINLSFGTWESHLSCRGNHIFPVPTCAGCLCACAWLCVHTVSVRGWARKMHVSCCDQSSNLRYRKKLNHW